MLNTGEEVPIPNASMCLCEYNTSIYVRICFYIFCIFSYLTPQLNTLWMEAFLSNVNERLQCCNVYF